MTVLCAVDTLSGLGLEVNVGGKEQDKLAEAELVKLLTEIGRANCILFGDKEPASSDQLHAAKLGTAATYRTTATYSPASKGNVEKGHSTVLGQTKTLSRLMQFQ